MTKTTEARENTIIAQEKELIALAWNSLVLDKTTGKITDIDEDNFETELNNSGNNTQVDYVDNDANKDFSVTFIDTTHEYIVNKNGNITLKGTNIITQPAPVVLSSIKSWTSNANTDFHKESIRNSITEIEFVDYLPNPINLNENTCWDVSQEGNQSIIAWLNGTKLYIGGNGGVKANEDSSCVFYNFPNLTSIKFNNNYNTSDVTNMNGMFSACYSLSKLDLSSFNTSKVTNMSCMFGSDYVWNSSADSKKMNLAEIKGLANFNTSNVTTMNNMFWNCGNLTSLDLGNFDTSNVADLGGMFNMPNDNSSQLKTIYVNNNWNTDKFSNSVNMFIECANLVGGNGTKVSSQNKTNARIDKSDTPGYFTDKRQNLASNNTELEYIESTGTQYIDTGVIPNQNTGFEIDFITSSDFNTATSSGVIFGVRKTSYANGNNSWIWENVLELDTWTGLSQGGSILFGNQTSGNVANMTKNTRMQISLKNGIYTDPLGNSTTLDTTSYTAPYNLFLFALYDASYSTNPTYYSKVKLYSFKLYDGNTLIRNFIPVHNTITNSAGLYDTINNKFYPNNGTGSFTEAEITNN